MKILHIITGLDTGGAETMLVKVAGGLSAHGHVQKVVSLTGSGTVTHLLQDVGIPVVELSLKDPRRSIIDFFRLRRTIRRFRPDVVQSWMYHADFVSAITVPRGILLVWNVRHSVNDLKNESPFIRLLIKISPFISRRPNKILFNSYVSRDQHIGFGYPRKKCWVIPNGFDTGQFHPDSELRSRLCETWSFPEDSLVIGNIARYHPMKNHFGLIQAFARCISERPDIPLYLVMVGRSVTAENEKLMGAISHEKVQNRVRLLGRVPRPETVMPGFDIYCSPSSWGEGFPNVIGEAMSCGVPCVVTDVGDSASVVDETAVVTKGSDSESIAVGLLQMMNFGTAKRKQLGVQARERIIKYYSINNIVDRYEELYKRLVG